MTNKQWTEPKRVIDAPNFTAVANVGVSATPEQRRAFQ